VLRGRILSFMRGFIYGPWVVWRRTQPDRITTIALRQRLFGIILIAALLVYILFPGAVTATLLAGMAGIFLWAFLWARQMAVHVRAQRLLRYHAVQVGDELEETIQLVNASSNEVLWAEVVDHSNLPGYSMTSVRAASGRQSVDWRLRAVCRQRGVFELGPWELLLGDPFGIFRVTQAYSTRREVLVYPPLAELPGLALPHRQSVGDRRPLRQPLPAETIQALTARPFAPGDPLRRIHWRTTARRGSLFSKQFEPEAASRIWLIPDFDARVHGAHEGESTLETAVTLTATLAALLLEEHLEVGLAAHADQRRILLPQRGSAQLWPILLALAPLKSVFDQPLVQVLRQIRPLINTHDLVLVVTPSISPDWPSVLRQLSGASRGGAASVYLIDPASYGMRQEAHSLEPLLADLGIQTRIIHKGDIKIRTAAYGPLSRWEFKVLGTGRVIVSRAPTLAAPAGAGANLSGEPRS